MKEREEFGSRVAYILALTGSAVGLGNIWRFPYMMGEHGGAAFLITYLFFAAVIAMPIMLCESLIGRRARTGTYDAMKILSPNKGWRLLGGISVFAAFTIASYYSVVGGWSIDYLVRSVFTGFKGLDHYSAAALSYRVFSSPWEPIIFHTLFLLTCSTVIFFGVRKGIEKISKLTMPLLFLLMVIIMVYALFLPGSFNGVKYLLKPDWSQFTPKMMAAALGQSFFSMSLGMGAVLVYSSYSKKSDNLLSSACWTVLFDSGFALIAGFAIMATVFAIGANPGSGPTLVFETLPYIFSQMGLDSPLAARLISIGFFLAVALAALTSEMSMIEVSVSHFIEHRGMSRAKASLLVFVLAWIIGILCCMSFGSLSQFKLFGYTLFDLFNMVSSDVLMTLGALGFSIFVGWVMDKAVVRDELTNGGTMKGNSILFKPLYFIIKWVAPVMILIIFLTNLFL